MGKKPKNTPLLRSMDVAHILDCSPDDVSTLASKGKLPAKKVGHQWRFSFEEVRKYKKKLVGKAC